MLGGSNMRSKPTVSMFAPSEHAFARRTDSMFRKRSDPPSSRNMSGTRRHGTCFRCDAQRMFGQSEHAYGRLGTHVRTFLHASSVQTHVRTVRTCVRGENACSRYANLLAYVANACRDAPDMRACFMNACSDVSNMRSTRKTHVRGV